MADSTISNLPTSTSPSAATYAPIEDTLVNYKITLPNLVLAGGGVIINAASQQNGYINISSYLRSGSSFFYPTSLVMLGTGTFGTGQKASLYDDGTNAIFQAATGGAAYLYANAGASSNNLKLDTSNNATLSGSGAFKTGSSVYGATSATINGSLALVGAITGATTGGFSGVVTALSFTGSGAGLTAGTIPNAALVTTPVTSVTASGNLSSSGGATPAITLTATPSFTSVTISTALALSSGGTGSTTKNFVDLSTAQTVAGIKTFSSAPVMSGASITAGTLNIGAGGVQTGVLPLANGGTGALSLAASPFVVLSPASQQTGTVNTSGNHITGGSFVAGSTQINATSIVLSNGATSVNVDYGVTSNGVVTFSKPLAMNSLPYSFMRNKLKNGAIAIDQRNNGAAIYASVAGYSSSPFSADRWRLANFAGSATSKWYGQQIALQASFGTGTGYELAVYAASSYTVVAADQMAITQAIEGFDWQDTLWGTSAAKPVTLSFWAYASVAGTYSVALQNYANTRSYVSTFSLVANTYTYIAITIPGDVSGTWLNSSAAGAALLLFNVGTGTSASTSSANTWLTGNYSNLSGTTQLVATASSALALTGVQLEVGSQATPFEQRPYGTELALCQRYFLAVALGSTAVSYVGQCYGTSAAVVNVPFPTTMRTSPTLAAIGSTWQLTTASFGLATFSAPTIYYASTSQATLQFTGGSGVVAGNATVFVPNAVQLNFSAEL